MIMKPKIGRPPVLIVSGQKVCTKCDMWKHLEEFSNACNTVSGKQSRCKDCEREDSKVRYPNRTDHSSEILVGSFECTGCGELKPAEDYFKDKQSTRGLTTKCKTCRSYDQILNTYGLTREAHTEMMENQKGTCPACMVFKGCSPGDLVVDHCHDTGNVRVLLCLGCNTIEGTCKKVFGMNATFWTTVNMNLSILAMKEES